MKNLIFSLIFTSILCANLARGQREELNVGRSLEEQKRMEEALQLYTVLHQKYPQDLRVFHALKRVHFKLEKYDEFINLIGKAYKVNPTSEYALALGEANLRMDRMKDAKEWLALFIEESGTEGSLHKVASIYISMGMLEEAAKTYEEGRKKFKNDFLFIKEMALLYRNSNLERSVRESIRLYLTTPEERVWVERMLKQEVKKGNQSTVLRVIKEEVTSHRDNRDLNILLGDILVELNDYEGALDEYRLSEETKALLRLAKECKEEGKFELALKAYEDYFEKNPNSTEAHIGMGDCFFALGSLDKAEEFYERAVDAPDREDAVQALFRLSEIKTIRGDFVAARNYYRKVEKRFPFVATEATFRIIGTYMREGKLTQAATECENAIRADEVRAHYLLGEINYYKGDFSKAKEYYEKVTNHSPNTIWVNDSMERLILLGAPDEELKIYAQADALLLQCKYDESIEVSKKFLKENPSSEISPNALFLIALSYEQKGQPTVAVEGYRDMIDNYPKSYLCPHAQYRIGLLYLNEFKDVGSAKRELETVLLKYPESMIAEKVRNELRGLD